MKTVTQKECPDVAIIVQAINQLAFIKSHLQIHEFVLEGGDESLVSILITLASMGDNAVDAASKRVAFSSALFFLAQISDDPNIQNSEEGFSIREVLFSRRPPLLNSVVPLLKHASSDDEVSIFRIFSTLTSRDAIDSATLYLSLVGEGITGFLRSIEEGPLKSSHSSQEGDDATLRHGTLHAECHKCIRNIGRFPNFRSGLKVFTPRLLSSLSSPRGKFFSIEGIEAIINIACVKTSKDIILRHNGVDVLTKILENDEVSLEAKEAAAAGLGCLSDFYERGQEAVGERNTINALMKIIAGEIQFLALHVAVMDVCCNIALAPLNSIKIVSEGGIAHFLRHTISQDSNLRENAVRALGITLKTLKAAATRIPAGRNMFGVPIEADNDGGNEAEYEKALVEALGQFRSCGGMGLLNACAELEVKLHAKKSEISTFRVGWVQPQRNTTCMHVNTPSGHKPVSNTHKLVLDIMEDFCSGNSVAY